MSKKRDIVVVIVSAILITVLFHKQALGLNLLIFETILFAWIIFSKQLHFKGLYPITLSLGLLTTSLFTVLTHSVFSYVINFLVLFAFVGLIIYPDIKSLISVLGLSFSNVFSSQIHFYKELSSSKLNGQKIGSYIRKFRFFIIPIIIVIFFITIYRMSNPIFDNIVGDIVLFVQDKLNLIFKDFDFLIIVTFLIGLIISIFIFFRTANKQIIEFDINSSEELKRERKGQKNFRIMGLVNEYKVGVFMFAFLNLVLLVLNIADIKWV